MSEMFSRVVAAISIIILLMLGVAIADSLGQTTGGIEESRDEAVLLDSAGSFTDIDNGKGTGETVVNSRGYAINLTGASNSYVKSEQPIKFSSDQNWTVSVWAYVEQESATDNMTAVSLDGRVLIWYNGTAGNWSLWYYDEAARNSYQVNVSVAGEQPGNFTNIMGVANGTHVSIYRNNTRGDIKSITTSSSADAPINATSWNGRIDELETFNESLTSSERSDEVSSPNAPHKGVDQTARVMFDESKKDTQSIFFADGRLSQFNVAFSSGLSGSTMTGGGVDYTWNTNGPKIQATMGGNLDGAPVAYITYTFEGTGNRVLTDFGISLQTAAIIPIIIIFVLIVSRIRMAQ